MACVHESARPDEQDFPQGLPRPGVAAVNTEQRTDGEGDHVFIRNEDQVRRKPLRLRHYQHSFVPDYTTQLLYRPSKAEACHKHICHREYALSLVQDM